ncbi:hypothetical protein FA95DRAFT_1678994 [Auriscalpium vulgare]|uniref:Uncharacterized protein n=1 Tax=Auriscalpium vulgare TaxID=40419 RepID=A0ACB8RUP9_9AGAM|nr:hypothetical protein FA95DRAFT_1678994 [Auriscalpium vulgare]
MPLLPVQISVLALLADVYLYGIYSLLCAFTLFILSPKFKGNFTNKCLVGATLVMYLVSTSSVVLHTVEYLQLLALDPVDSALKDSTKPYAKASVLDGLAYSIPAIHFIFGDAIVVWRLWVIWIHSWRIVVGPLILLFCTSAVVLAQIVLAATSCAAGDLQAICIGTEPSALWKFMPVKLYFASLALTLCTNCIVTGLIAYRAWIHYRSSQVMRIRIGRDRTLAVLLLLVESGALYCGIWMSLIILWPFAISDPQRVYRFTDLIPQLTGMYPTVIIVICALQRSYADTVISSPDDLTAVTFCAGVQPASPATGWETRLPCSEEERTTEGGTLRNRTNSRSSIGASMSSVDFVREAAKIA